MKRMTIKVNNNKIANTVTEMVKFGKSFVHLIGLFLVANFWQVKVIYISVWLFCVSIYCPLMSIDSILSDVGVYGYVQFHLFRGTFHRLCNFLISFFVVQFSLNEPAKGNLIFIFNCFSRKKPSILPQIFRISVQSTAFFLNRIPKREIPCLHSTQVLLYHLLRIHCTVQTP